MKPKRTLVETAATIRGNQGSYLLTRTTVKKLLDAGDQQLAALGKERDNAVLALRGLLQHHEKMAKALAGWLEEHYPAPAAEGAAEPAADG